MAHGTKHLIAWTFETLAYDLRDPAQARGRRLVSLLHFTPTVRVKSSNFNLLAHSAELQYHCSGVKKRHATHVENREGIQYARLRLLCPG